MVATIYFYLVVLRPLQKNHLLLVSKLPSGTAPE